MRVEAVFRPVAVEPLLVPGLRGPGAALWLLAALAQFARPALLRVL